MVATDSVGELGRGELLEVLLVVTVVLVVKVLGVVVVLVVDIFVTLVDVDVLLVLGLGSDSSTRAWASAPTINDTISRRLFTVALATATLKLPPCAASASRLFRDESLSTVSVFTSTSVTVHGVRELVATDSFADRRRPRAEKTDRRRARMRTDESLRRERAESSPTCCKIMIMFMGKHSLDWSCIRNCCILI